jgi:hypothetical protein
MDQARSVTATFTVRKRALSVSTAGSGGGFVSSAPAGIDCGGPGHADCAEDYAHGTKVTLIAHPASDSDFGGFSGAGCSGTDTTCEVTMDQARSVTAAFNTKPAPQQPSSQQQQTQTPQTPASGGEVKPAKLVVSHRRRRLKGGHVLIELRCKGMTGQSCEGTIRLAHGTKVRFSIAAGKRKTIALTPPRSTRLQIARRGEAASVVLVTLADGPTRRLDVSLAAG